VPAAPGAPAALTFTQTLQGLEVRSGAATVFRHTDGNWHVRVTYSVRNTGAEPVDVQRESFKVDDMAPASGHSTFPNHVSINPGMTATGDIAWWFSSSTAQPRAVTVKYQPGDGDAPVLGTQAYAPVFAPVEPAPGAVPTAAVYTLPVTAVGTGLTFVHTDGNRHYRVNLQVQNTTSAPLRVWRDHFHAQVGEVEGNHANQTELTTWNDPTVIAPGASATATLGFWFSGDPAPNPTALRVVFGSLSSPQADLQAPVAAGASVIQ